MPIQIEENYSVSKKIEENYFMFIQPGPLASLLQIARVGSWINDVHKIANDTSQAGIHHARTKMSAWPELSGTCHVMLTQDRFWSMQKRCHDWSKRSQTGDFSTVIGTGVLFDLLSLNQARPGGCAAGSLEQGPNFQGAPNSRAVAHRAYWKYKTGTCYFLVAG